MAMLQNHGTSKMDLPIPWSNMAQHFCCPMVLVIKGPISSDSGPTKGIKQPPKTESLGLSSPHLTKERESNLLTIKQLTPPEN